MRKMYSKKQIEGMFANRSVMISDGSATYAFTTLLPKSVTIDTLKEAMPQFVGACMGISDFAGHYIYLQYAQKAWALKIDGTNKTITSIRIQ